MKKFYVPFLIAILFVISCNALSSSQPPKVAPTTYIVMLICDDCAQEPVMDINVWQNAGTSRGNVTFSVPHKTTVNVLGNKIADDGRLWYEVEYKGKTGWIAEDFVSK